jgi:hypothetical protein
VIDAKKPHDGKYQAAICAVWNERLAAKVCFALFDRKEISTDAPYSGAGFGRIQALPGIATSAVRSEPDNAGQ